MATPRVPIRIFGAPKIERLHWEADLFDVCCTRECDWFTKISLAKADAEEWCKQLGMKAVFSVDDDCLENPIYED